MLLAVVIMNMVYLTSLTLPLPLPLPLTLTLALTQVYLTSETRVRIDEPGMPQRPNAPTLQCLKNALMTYHGPLLSPTAYHGRTCPNDLPWQASTTRRSS